MSSDEESPKSIDKQTTSSKKLLDEQRKKCAETRAGIDSFIDDLSEETTEIVTLAKAQEQKVANFIGTVNSEVDATQNDAVNTFNGIIESYNSVKEWLYSIYDSALKVGFVMIVFITLAYYLYHLYVNAWQVDTTVLSAFLVIPVTALFYFLMRSFKSKIDNRFSVNTQIDQAREKTKVFLKTHMKLNPIIFDSVIHAVDKAKNLGYRTLDAFRTYIPQLDNYYDSLERLDRQELFKRTLSNALVSYGWDLKDDINEYIKNFPPLTNSTQEWLAKASGELSAKLNVPPVFITLIYSDYVGDLETSKNAWSAIKEANIVQTFIKKIVENKLVETEFLDSNSNNFGSIEELVINQEAFSLETFRQLYHHLYFDVAREKLSLINSLRRYQFELSSLGENRIKKFVPKSIDADNRHEGLIKCASIEVNQPAEMVALAFYEQELESTKRNKIWRKLCEVEAKVLRLRFIDYLVEKRLIDIPLHYRKDRAHLLEYIDSKITALENYTLANVNSELNTVFMILEDTKKHILRALTYYNLGIENENIRDNFQSLLQIDDGEQALVDWVSCQLKMSSDIVLLFYFDYIQDEKSQDVFERILQKGLVPELSKTLLENHIISSDSSADIEVDITNLSTIISVQKEFNRKTTQFYFDKCNRLLEYQKEYAKFLSLEKMIENPVTNFARVFEIIRPKINEDLLTLLDVLSLDYMEQNCKGIYGNWTDSVATATLVLLLEQKHDYLVFEACKKASLNIRTVKILYCKISVQESDELNAREKTPLKYIIEKAIKNSDENYEFIAPFKFKLSQGTLYPKISVLVDSVLKDLQTNVKEKQQRLSSMVERITKQVRVFLEGQLNYDITLKSLKMNVVSAYMITTPATRVRVIGKVIGEYLPIVCSEANTTEDFLIISEEITGGKGTRLGIVPFGMSFDAFNERFCKLFKQAVDRYFTAESVKGVQPEDFAANLIRIVPSEAFFKRVVGGLEEEDIESESHPINTIRQLMIARFPSLRNIELVASLKGGDEKPTITMKNLIIDLLDNQSKISLFIESEIRPIIGATKLMDKIESGELDNILVKEFNYTRLSELCTTTYKLSAKGNKSADTVRSRIKKNIESLRGKDDVLSSEQLSFVTESVMIVLQSWGAVIEGFSEEKSWSAL